MKTNSLILEHYVPSNKKYGYPLLFIHGMWGGSWIFKNYTTYAVKEGYEVYAVNLRGHHNSGHTENLGKVSVMDYVKDVIKLIQEIGPVVLVGHSMGGLIAQKTVSLLAKEYVPGAVFVTSAAPMWIPVITPLLLSRMLKGVYLKAMFFNKSFIFHKDDSVALMFNCMEEDKAHEAVYCSVPESGRAARELALGLIRVDAKSVTCPTLVVGAEKDLMTPANVQQKIANKYGSDYLLMHGHGHMLMLENGWGESISKILEWVKKNIVD